MVVEYFNYFLCLCETDIMLPIWGVSYQSIESVWITPLKWICTSYILLELWAFLAFCLVVYICRASGLQDINNNIAIIINTHVGPQTEPDSQRWLQDGLAPSLSKAFHLLNCFFDFRLATREKAQWALFQGIKERFKRNGWQSLLTLELYNNNFSVCCKYFYS